MYAEHGQKIHHFFTASSHILHTSVVTYRELLMGLWDFQR